MQALPTRIVPAGQEMQVPSWQIISVPQLVPFIAFVPVSMQTAAPLLQVSVPVWHLLLGVHGDPALQATQAPWLHTCPFPQAMPLGASPLAAQTGAPVVQAILPVLQGIPASSQDMSAVQGVHSPAALQTRLLPQVLPVALARPVSMQLAMPPAQVSVPS